MYRLGVPRPSLLTLKNVFCRYCVYDISKYCLFLLVLSVLLGWQWWKMNLVYVKNIFVEFLGSKD